MNVNDSHKGKELMRWFCNMNRVQKMARPSFFDENSFLTIIEFYHNEDRLKEAIEVAGQAIERYLFSVDFYLKKAELLIDAGDEQAALNTLEQAENFAPGQLEILLLKAEALTYMDRGGEALELLDYARAFNDGANQGELYLLESLVHEFHQDYDQMFHVLKDALKQDPQNDEILERIWVAVELSRKYKQSITLHKQIIDKHPYSYFAWYNLGHAYAYLGNYKDAIEAYEYAFIINEKFEYAIRDCAELCFETGQF
jgi:tetratricopeptide (TPR) repeat protein